MPCENCAVQFSVFRRKRTCSECERYYCSGCLRRGGGICSPCRLLSTRPISRQTIAHLKVRDLQCFLQRQNVSTRGCVEKEELVTLCVCHVNSAGYRRHGARNGSSPFSSLKGFTNNINDFINSAFDLRQNSQCPPHNTHSNCFNNAHMHAPPADATSTRRSERFTTTPGGERDISVPVPAGAAGAAGEAGEARPAVESADCFEIEDLDDAGWEVVTRPADPLPDDSEVLIAENNAEEERGERTGGASERNRERSGERSEERGGERSRGRGGGQDRTPQRAASELELRPVAAEDGDSGDSGDTTSLRDEPLMDDDRSLNQKGGGGRGLARRVSLSELQHEGELAGLSVRQLKELLARNRVGFSGCVERGELQARAALLLRHRAPPPAAAADDLPLADACKICMCAPLECVLLECGHMAACTACAKQLAACPICRQYVLRAVRVFRS